MADEGLRFSRQVGIPITYRGRLIGEYRPDLVVEEIVVVEIKSVERLIGLHQAQLLAYMRILKSPVGLLLNFNGEGAKGWGVVNMGISGNRVLNDGAGLNALARLNRDVFSTPGVKAVVIFEGVNDLGVGYGHFEGPLAELFKSLAVGPKPTAETFAVARERFGTCPRSRGRSCRAMSAPP